MSLVVFGLSHHTSPIELRERLAISEAELPRALHALHKRLDGGGAVLLSTCNRIEAYVHHAAPPDVVIGEIHDFLSEWKGVPKEEFLNNAYDYAERDAVGHLFRVVSSLDSLVVGETQILGQVHEAYLMAHAEQVTDKVTSSFFQRAFAIAKKIRTQTNISAGKVSVSSVAVDLAASIFGDLDEKTVMVLGSGETGELTLKNLVDRGAQHVVVANRSLESAQALAAQYHGDAISLENIEMHLHAADIVITSTSASEYVLHPSHFHDALKKRKQAPMIVVDIAVPRDVDHEVKHIDNVYLYDIDDLQQIAGQNMAARRDEMERCLQMVEDSADKFYGWIHSLAAEPTIVSMSQELNAIRERELQKTLAALKYPENATPEQVDAINQEVEYLTKRITNAILQRPMTQLKEEIAKDQNAAVLHLVRRLFGLKEST